MNINAAIPARANKPDSESSDQPRSNERNFAQSLDDMNRESQLTEYFQVLLRRRWIVIAGVVLGTILAAVISWTTTPLYRATTSLEIAREAEKIVSVQGVDPGSRASGNEFYPTQYGLLKSRSLALAVVRELRLDQNSQFLYGYAGSASDAAKSQGQNVDRSALQQRAAAIVQGNLTITPVRNSSLVSVSFDSPDPDLSQRVANAIAANFISANLSRRFESSAYARKFLEEQLAETRSKLEESERAAVNYADRQQIINFEGQQLPNGGGARSAGQSLVEAELAALNTSLVTARSERIGFEARYDQARKRGGAALAESLSDAAGSAIRERRAELSAEYSKSLARFKPDYPTMVALRQQIAQIDRQLGGQGQAILGTLQTDYRAALQRENALQDKVSLLKNQMLDLRRRSIQYNIYQRDADTNRILYDGLLQRYKEIGIAGGVGNNNVAVVDQATRPGTPYTPRTRLNLLLGLLGGLLVGALLAFLLEQLDESIVAPHDLERKLGVPLLGSIPRVGDNEDKPYAMLEDPKSVVSEAYLSVQTALQFTTNHGAPRSFIVTSSRTSEGKTTSSVALSRNLAARGRKVLLIDADMRNPSIHKFFGVRNLIGFSDLLSGNDDLAKLTQPGPIPTLTIITSGPIPPNPSELLSGMRLSEVLERLLTVYDHVVFDAPPVMGLADSPIIAAQVEGAVFVIAAVETRAKAARIALRRLADVQAHIIGAILTKFNVKQVGYEYGYSYDYGERNTPRRNGQAG